ncbi:GAF and ANTAR domain-containing protein [Yinghuangia seranimata]|uniref:GAF and ANTAR domain-containing protein n=1 Tax=Yinghuangia seranimata TaxID=408067 RepID=UPI00248D333E|nr:GAF and ANTAR domain-containing protein [Yinghuangia seranimata]MDI2126972.1 GAF and ANTAR domain-containing protein [Yinghuangia seranimata]
MTDEATTLRRPDPHARSRAEAIRAWEVLAVPPDCYHEIAALAARLFDVPYCVVTVVDEDHVWFHGRHGLDLPGVPIAPGLCHEVVVTGRACGLDNAAADPLACANPLVAGEFGLRFYIGVPLRTADGHDIGTLSVFDTKPRPVPHERLDVLVSLAGLVVREFEIRLAAREAVAREQEERLAVQGRFADLTAALGTHGTIGQAMGILMAQRKMDSQAAFAALRDVSQRNNIKLAEVAQRLVADVERQLGR